MILQSGKTLKNKSVNRYWLMPATVAFIVNVFITATAHAQPQVWGSATPSVVEADTELVTLSWGSQNADSCEANGDIFPTSGSIPSGPFPAGSYSQSFSCTGPSGTSYYTMYWSAANPTPAPVLSSFSISPSVAYTTEPFTVSWSASNADTCSASSGDVFGGSGSTVFPAGALPVGYHSFSMQCTGPGGVSNVLYADVTIELPPTPVPATPTGLTSTHMSPETGASYTVSWNASPDASSYQLSQNGSAQTLTSTAQSFNPGSAGTYSYNVSACNTSGCSAVSASISVVVTDPPLTQPAYLIGFDADYKGYWSAGSASDLYFIRQSADGNYEGVSDFILQEQVDGSYSLIANPTPAQISHFNLTTPASVNYELADINLDGAVDMVLMDTSNSAAGIVYAAPTTLSAPVAYRHIDEEFVEFFADLYQGLLDPDYFYNTALENGWGQWVPYGPVSSQISWWDTSILFLSGQPFQPVFLSPHPEPPPFYQNLAEAFDGTVEPHWCALNGQDSYAFVNGVWVVAGRYREAMFVPDYSFFNQDAMDLAEDLRPIIESTGIGAGDSILTILEDKIGLGTSSQVLFSTTLIDGVIIDIDDFYTLADRQLFRSMSIFRMLRGIALLLIPGNYWDDPTAEYFHYTTEGGYPLILGSRNIVSDTWPHLVFFTTQIYPDGLTAMRRLATPSIRYGFFVISGRIGEQFIPGLVGPGIVAPANGQPGGGLEWTAPSPVSIGVNPLFVKIPSGL